MRKPTGGYCIRVATLNGARCRGINTHHIESWGEDEHGFCFINLASGEKLIVQESEAEVTALMGGVREA